jgi:3-dehydroquinate dehydratase/shikimate dehydrogenase
MNNGKVCVSVCAETADELIAQLKHAKVLADVIEIRFDCLNKNEIDILWLRLQQFRKEFDGILLATFRPKNRGQGGNRELSKKERSEFWDYCVFEFVDWADLEFDFNQEFSNTMSGILCKRLIWSFHAFGIVPNDYNLNLMFSKLSNLAQNKEPSISKMAIRTDDISDSIPIWNLLKRAKSENKQLIPIAMGEAGKWTRILGLAYGSPLTYASLKSGNETAPGQISAKDLIEVYRVKELDEQTEIYGIIGNPVSQSMSPYMHNAAFKHHNLNAVYIPFEVANLDEFIKRMVKHETSEIDWNLKGFSVTIPHKKSIIKHLDFIDEDAKKIGAVNTVHIVDGKLYGYNTDAEGFIEPLRNSYGDLKNAKVGIIGNGGAARACVYALKKEGANVTIFARNPDKAKDLADDFDVTLEEFQFPNSKLKAFDLLINSSPLGMKGEFKDQTPATAEQMKNLHMVYDLVYNPFETLFMREAKSIGVPTIGGLAMLVAQGMKQFEIWTGLEAPMKIMSRAALQRLK